MSKIEVNTVEPQCGTTLTLGGSGDTVTLGSGASQSGFGREGSVDWQTGSIKTSGFTAVSGEGYFCNTTSAAFTATLPASPSAGDIVAFKDYAQTFATNNLTVGRGGSNIEGVASDITLDTNAESVTFVYVDSTKGWVLVGESLTQYGEKFVTATGGTVTTCGNFKIHTFTGPGTFCVSCAGNAAGSNTVSYLVVAGAGGGGGSALGYYSGGGGGAGGFREGRTTTCSYTVSPLNAPAGLPVTAQAYPITVGGGGTGGTGSPSTCSPANRSPGGCGSNSVFSTITAAKGGSGGESGSNPSSTPNGGVSGGSGGGGGGYNGNPDGGLGAGNTPPVSPPQGNPGGAGSVPSSGHGGGGGGATSAGTGSTSASSYGNAGGTGATTHISGSPVTYAAGGAAGTVPPAPSGATDGGANTGDGGMGATNNPGDADGGIGGSGIVIIRYKFQ